MKFQKILTLFIVLIAAFSFTSCSSTNPFGKSKEIPTLFPIKQKDKWGYINAKGEIVINPLFDSADYFTEGLGRVKLGEKYGYIDSTGQYVINPQFEISRPFQEGLAVILVNKKVGFIDKTGKIVINPQFGIAVSDFSEGLAPVEIGEKFGYIDATGKIVINPQFDKAEGFSEGLAAVKVGDQFGFIDKTGKFVINPQFKLAFSFAQGLSPVTTGNDQFGYVDKTGKMVINPAFDLAIPFNENGFAIVMNLVDKKNKYGIIDKTGKYLINPQFDDIGASLSDDAADLNLIPVKTDVNFGYVNQKGEFVINPQFEAAGAFLGELAQVKTDGVMAYIDKTGKVVWKEPKEIQKADASNSNNSNLLSNANVTVTANSNSVVSSNSNTVLANSTSSKSFTKEFEGTLNYDYQITMRLERKNGSLSGTVTPKTGYSRITVSGTIEENNSFELKEYDNLSNLTGLYKGRITSDGKIEGKWTKPDGSAQKPLLLTEKNSSTKRF